MTVEIAEINRLLANLNNPTATVGVKKVEKTGSNNVDIDGYGEYTIIYETPLENVFMSITYRTDSYGENNHIYKVQFVQPREKVVVNYDPTN